MDETPTMSPEGRAAVVFQAGPTPTLRCAYCGSIVTDDDADCPTCTTPIDWGASLQALREWQRHGT